MRFSRDLIVDVWDEAVDLLVANHVETGALTQDQFSPDRKRYELLERGGMLRLFTARDDRCDELVGYCTVLVMYHLHYQNTLWAMQDVLYLHPSCRGYGSFRFIKYIDQRLEDEGVEYILRHVTIKKDYSAMLDRMGYEETETGYVRRIHGT